MYNLLRVIGAVGLSAILCACASASAKSSDRPDLVIPPPPPRVIPINSEPIAEPVPELPSGASSAPARTPARPTAPRPAASDPKNEPKGGEAKTDPKPADTPPQPDPAPPVAPPAAAPQLRTVESSAAESGVRASLERTRTLLSGVDYRRLSTARKRAYDDAKRFAQQAEDALNAGNAAFAQGVATKAETLAHELSGK